ALASRLVPLFTVLCSPFASFNGHEKAAASPAASRSWYQTSPCRRFGQGQHPGPVLEDRDGVLEMGRQRAVLGGDRPFVLVEVDLRPARRDHRLDRQGHAGLEERAAARTAEVRDLRVLLVG